MIEFSRTTHTHITMERENLVAAIIRYFLNAGNITIPTEASITVTNDGAVIEFTEHEGPDLTERKGLEAALTREKLNDELIASLNHEDGE